MPSSDGRSRRRLLAGLGTGLVAGLGGCAGRVPGAGPARVESVESRTERGIRWDYPPRPDSDRDGIGYAAATVRGLRGRAAGGPALRVVLNSTVGDIAAGRQYEGYRADWFRFRMGPVPSAADPAPRMRVQPPPWPDLRVRYDGEGRRRWLVVSAPEVGADGTITFPVVVLPTDDPVPDRLRCTFTVQVSQPGPVGRTIRTTGDGTLDVAGALDR